MSDAAARRRAAIPMALAGLALLTIMDAVLKARFADTPFVQAVFLRFLMGFFVAGGVWVLVRPPFPGRDRLYANALRGSLVAVTATTFFYSVKLLPLAEALALSFLSPVFVALFGAILLGERSGRPVLIGLACGLLGMAVMVGPKLGGGGAVPAPLLGVAAALVSAVSYAFNLVLLRKLAQRDHPVVIVAAQNAVPALILALPAAYVWQMPDAADLAAFLAAGALAVGGHLLLTGAFARLEASRLAPLEYTTLIWASGIGYAVFGEALTWATLAGAGLIILGSLAASRR